MKRARERGRPPPPLVSLLSLIEKKSVCENWKRRTYSVEWRKARENRRKGGNNGKPGWQALRLDSTRACLLLIIIIILRFPHPPSGQQSRSAADAISTATAWPVWRSGGIANSLFFLVVHVGQTRKYFSLMITVPRHVDVRTTNLEWNILAWARAPSRLLLFLDPLPRLSHHPRFTLLCLVFHPSSAAVWSSSPSSPVEGQATAAHHSCSNHRRVSDANSLMRKTAGKKRKDVQEPFNHRVFFLPPGTELPVSRIYSDLFCAPRSFSGWRGPLQKTR